MMRNCSVRTGSNRILRIFFFISDIRAGISARIGLILIHGYRIGAITVYIYICFEQNRSLLHCCYVPFHKVRVGNGGFRWNGLKTVAV